MISEVEKRTRFVPISRGLTTSVMRGTQTESLAVEQVSPVGAELTRAARRFQLAYNGSAPTGIAPVQALPLAAAQWAVWNADPAKSLFIEALGAFPASGTPAAGGQLLACLFQTPAQTGSNATGLVVASCSTGGVSRAIVKSAVTITTPAVGLWIPIAENASPNVGAFPGSGLIIRRDLVGKLIVPPGYGLGLAVLAGAGTTPLYVPIAEWVEIESDNEA